MDQNQIKTFLAARGEPDYRFRQILKNYYSGRYQSFGQMTDLPLALRQELDNFALLSVKQIKNIDAPGTKKALLSLADDLKIETVLMDYDQWLTACISSQVGCPLGCTFCATGKMGFSRNLTATEIVDQVLFWNSQLYPRYIGRVVFMGMGEPFLNYDQVLLAIDILASELKIGHRKMSLSTAGIVPQIKKFADLNNQVNLAISLHSTVEATRRQLMPIAKTYSLADLRDACLYYVNHTRRQLFFEYALIKDVTDTPVAISSLIDWLKQNYLFFLNLIPLNPTGGSLVPTTFARQSEIESLLTRQKIPFTIRQSFGQNIAAACGQLAAAN